MHRQLLDLQVLLEMTGARQSSWRRLEVSPVGVSIAGTWLAWHFYIDLVSRRVSRGIYDYDRHTQHNLQSPNVEIQQAGTRLEAFAR